MKINEILNEQGVGSLNVGVEHTLPNVLVFPKLVNTDPYLQYRFGLAIAAAGAVEDGEVEYEKSSAFGEQLAIVARTKEEEDIVNLARKLYGADANYKSVSTKGSDEAPDVNAKSPVANLGPVKNKNAVNTTEEVDTETNTETEDEQ